MADHQTPEPPGQTLPVRNAPALTLLAWCRGLGDTEWVEALLATQSLLWGSWLSAPWAPAWVSAFPGRSLLFRFLVAIAPLWTWGAVGAALGLVRLVSLELCLQWTMRRQTDDTPNHRRRFWLAYCARRYTAGMGALYWGYLLVAFIRADILAPGMPFYGGMALFSALVYFAMAPLPPPGEHPPEPEE